MKKNIFYWLFFSLLVSAPLSGEISSWDSYGGLNWDISFNRNYHTGPFSAKAWGPKSGLTYGFIYQIIPIDPRLTYCLTLYVSNVNMTKAGGEFGYREDPNFYSSSFGGVSSDDESEVYETVPSTAWKLLATNNTPGSTNYHYAKVGLKVYYSSGSLNVLAFFDDVKFFATNNRSVNLIQNGSFDSGWNYPVPPTLTEDYRISAFPKSFTPRGYDNLTSINIKIMKSGSYVQAELLSLDGYVKKTFYKDFLDNPGTSIIWDGKDDLGNILAMGIYILRMRVVEYTDKIPTEKEFRSTLVIGNNLR